MTPEMIKKRDWLADECTIKASTMNAVFKDGWDGCHDELMPGVKMLLGALEDSAAHGYSFEIHNMVEQAKELLGVEDEP